MYTVYCIACFNFIPIVYCLACFVRLNFFVFKPISHIKNINISVLFHSVTLNIISYDNLSSKNGNRHTYSYIYRYNILLVHINIYSIYSVLYVYYKGTDNKSKNIIVVITFPLVLHQLLLISLHLFISGIHIILQHFNAENSLIRMGNCQCCVGAGAKLSGRSVIKVLNSGNF